MAGDQRLEVIENVRALFAGDKRIDGPVLIGSGAVGFRDELSDVDLIAAVASGFETTAVGDDLGGSLRSALPLYRYIQTPPARARGIHVFLLESHLELDLSFVSTDGLSAEPSVATSPSTKIVFDRTGRVAEQLSRPRPEAPNREEQAQFRYLAGCGALWYGLKALRRGEHLFAADKLAELRSHVSALACLRQFGADQDSARRADELPEDVRLVLQGLTCAATAPELTAAFRDAVEALAMYDRELLRNEFGSREYAGLAEWLSSKDISP